MPRAVVQGANDDVEALGDPLVEDDQRRAEDADNDGQGAKFGGGL